MPVRRAPRTRVDDGPRAAWALATGDLLSVLLATLLAVVVGPVRLADGGAVLFVVVASTWLLLLAATGNYEVRLGLFRRDDLRRLAQAGIDLFVATWLLSFLLDVGSATAADAALLSAAATAATVTHRVVGARRSERRRRQHQAGPLRVVLAGHRGAVAAALTELARTAHDRFEVGAVCLPHQAHDDDFGVPTAAGFGHLAELAEQRSARAVIVLPCPHFDTPTLRRLRWSLAESGVELFVASGLYDVADSHASVSYAGTVRLVHIRPSQLRGGRHTVEECCERVLAALALVLLTPLLLVLSLAIRHESAGPAIFRQVRVGRDGQRFTMFKFRTMTGDAEDQGRNLLGLNDADGPLFKLRADPRVTRLGRVLRTYSLDELPQLWNVVRGQMSLVGPRPALPAEVSRYDADTRRRLAVKPGITGLWQVSGRSDLPWSEAVRLDLRYVDNWSITQDLLIIGRTFGAVVHHRGAY
ncbi:MAG TPA: exopolysaccharide biosynthesis polyprenyl glycosylphosphotransferase [Nocardioides sp.]|nr:exopolysaccharide biosynthesis polyprenyl glycosylphosphotransferase [Nocardioides sp.]